MSAIAPNRDATGASRDVFVLLEHERDRALFVRSRDAVCRTICRDRSQSRSQRGRPQQRHSPQSKDESAVKFIQP
jgi:hypothetical protein